MAFTQKAKYCFIGLLAECTKGRRQFSKNKKLFLDKERYLRVYIEMIWHYNLRILFEEVCNFLSSLTVAQKIYSQNILERLVHEEKYKLIHYTVLEGVAYQSLLNRSFSLNDDLAATNLQYCSCV